MSRQGNCPKCGADLSYDGRVLRTDDGHSEPVSCGQCGWQGYENYREMFTGHEPREGGDEGRPVKHYIVNPPPREDEDRSWRTYRVVYEIDLTGQSPAQAAEEAWQWLQEPGSMPPVFTVLDSDGNQTTVDLYERGLEERGLELESPDPA